MGGGTLHPCLFFPFFTHIPPFPHCLTLISLLFFCFGSRAQAGLILVGGKRLRAPRKLSGRLAKEATIIQPQQRRRGGGASQVAFIQIHGGRVGFGKNASGREKPQIRRSDSDVLVSPLFALISPLFSPLCRTYFPCFILIPPLFHPYFTLASTLLLASPLFPISSSFSLICTLVSHIFP